jgi:hypothetical protein
VDAHCGAIAVTSVNGINFGWPDCVTRIYLGRVLPRSHCVTTEFRQA